MLKKRVSFLTLVIAVLIAGAAAYASSVLIGKKQKVNIPSGPNCTETMEQIRIKSYEFVHPLLLTDINEESGSLSPIRGKLDNFISTLKNARQVDEVSVYFRKLDDGSWFAINPNQSYNPASMSKIIYVLVYLKEAESNPSVLNKKIFFAKHFEGGNTPNIVDFKLPENAYYSVRDLLTYCIKYSDNDATLLLSQNMNVHIYEQLFNDLHISSPDPYKEYYITPIDYSKFFRVLYNATYIRPELSEYGLKLLTLSTYANGLKRGIEPNVVVAHKFGERIIGNKAQLHEFGIVFIDDNPYLLGVMTSGASLPQLADIVAEISRIVYVDYKEKYKSL